MCRCVNYKLTLDLLSAASQVLTSKCWEEPTSQTSVSPMPQNTHTHTSSLVLLTMAQDDGGLWVTLTHCRPPSLLYSSVQHRGLCAPSTISDHPSQTNLTAHGSLVPSSNCTLGLGPKSEPKTSRLDCKCPVIPLPVQSWEICHFNHWDRFIHTLLLTYQWQSHTNSEK